MSQPRQPQYPQQPYQPGEPVQPVQPVQPSEQAVFMAVRVLISWALVLTPIGYGIYVTLKSVNPLFGG